MTAKRNLLALLLALLLLLTVSACSGDPAPAGADLGELQAAMLAADDSLPQMTSVSSSMDDGEELFAYLSDLDYNKVSGYFLSYSADGLADEIAVVRMKEAADVSAMSDSLRAHVDGRIKLYENYQPDQVPRAEQALIFTSGNDVVLIISDGQAAVKTAYTQETAGGGKG
jgi:hypothetical protein